VFSQRKTGSRVNRPGKFQVLGEWPFEKPHNPYPVPKLPMKGTPRNRGFAFKYGKAITQPQVNVEGHWAVPDSLHGGAVYSYRMPSQSLKECPAEPNPPDERFAHRSVFESLHQTLVDLKASQIRADPEAHMAPSQLLDLSQRRIRYLATIWQA